MAITVGTKAISQGKSARKLSQKLLNLITTKENNKKFNCMFYSDKLRKAKISL